MKKKATRKDFYMEIKKSPGRFLSILFIVALGVSFFSGIRASEPDMRYTGDHYFDSTNLMDIKAFSTYGVTEDDIRAIEKLDGVEQAEGAYSADFLYETPEEQAVLHIMSLQEDMNEVAVSEGRLPEKVGECMADNEAGYEVGDVIELKSGTDDAVSDTLKTEKLTVVGLGSSPCYLSYSRGSTTVGSGSISAFLVVPEETFDLDVYTEVYVRVEGAEKLLAFTDAYDERIEEVVDNIEAITDDRAKVRRQELVDDANASLEDARQELEEGRQEAEAELADAAAQIEDAQNQIDDGKKKISDGRKQIETAKATLSSKQKELDTAQAEYNSGVKKLEEGRAAYEQGLAEYEANKPAAEAQIQEGRQQMAGLAVQIAEDEQQYETLISQIDLLASQLKSIEDKGEAATEEEKREAEGLKQQISELSETAGQLAYAISARKSVYSETTAQLDAAQKALDDGEAALVQSKAELDAADAGLASVPEQLKSGQAQIDVGWSELKKQVSALDAGESEIAENEAKLADARAEYEEGREEAESEIADGEQKIADAEAEIEDIEEPKWYVYDRSTLPEYTGFGDNAERLKAIGQVFPVLFFLVAALISLTSMTRMVEEQRTVIGTMKALGYGKFAIASKYLGYAFIATVGGSVIGVLIGEKVFPYIIVYAYGILYHHITEILIPYNWGYAAMASMAAVICTMGATLLSCYKALGAQPAVMMRPPTPKNGRRVFLERIGIIWRHLSFTWKSTIRNLMRYKKRFFMTIFGIGGCMALMLVGFGLRDSIYEIADIQYAEIQTYDGSIYLEDDISDEQRKKLDEFLDGDKDIERFINADMQNITLINGKKERQAYECVLASTDKAGQYVHFRDRKTKEKYELSDNGIVISEKTAKLLDAKVGDVIYIKDEENGNKEVKIEHICENYMGHYIYLTPNYYREVYGQEPEYNSILFAADESYTNNQKEKLGQAVLQEEGTLSVSYMHDIERQLNDMLKSLNLVIVVLIISAGMLAFVVLYNLNNINITERQRELATLKVLGFHDREVAEYVYRENILLTLIGAVVGVILGKALHLFVIQTVEVDAAMFGRIINLPSYLYSLFFTLLFSMLINGIMFFKLKKIDMVESLKSIE